MSIHITEETSVSNNSYENDYNNSVTLLISNPILILKFGTILTWYYFKSTHKDRMQDGQEHSGAKNVSKF